jgi:hypothetical protein
MHEWNERAISDSKRGSNGPHAAAPKRRHTGCGAASSGNVSGPYSGHPIPSGRLLRRRISSTGKGASAAGIEPSRLWLSSTTDTSTGTATCAAKHEQQKRTQRKNAGKQKAQQRKVQGAGHTGSKRNPDPALAALERTAVRSKHVLVLGCHFQGIDAGGQLHPAVRAVGVHIR